MIQSNFITHWTRRREEFQRLNVLVNGASLCDEVLKDFESFIDTEENALLTLKEAAQHSGYSQDHLGRLVRDGNLHNHGRQGAPRIRKGDVPRKVAAAVAPGSQSTYDPHADARKLGGRRRGGAHAS